MADLRLINVQKVFASFNVIKGVDLEIKDGELVVFVGPSGCGKSTLLRMIAGLEEITAGELFIGDRKMNDVHPRDRGIAMVFQSYALYPHMSVFENMGFGLKLAGVPKENLEARVREAARILQMEHLLDRKPSQLSGGQRQRVAIGRAIVRKPDVFLLDEPLSNLDAALRVDTRMELAKLHRDLGSTMIYVTHDQVEAMTLGDKIVVLEGGRIQQIGAPIDVYKRPANKFVAGFIGSPKMNFLPVTVEEVNGATARVGSGSVGSVTVAASGLLAGDKVLLAVRPQYLTVGRGNAGHAVVSGKVNRVERLGAETLVSFDTPLNEAVTATLPVDVNFDFDQPVQFSFNPEVAHIFPV